MPHRLDGRQRVAERAEPEDAPLENVDVGQRGLVAPRRGRVAIAAAAAAAAAAVAAAKPRRQRELRGLNPVAVAVEAHRVSLGAPEREGDRRGAPVRREHPG